MLTPDGPVVIDWRTTAEGPSALDRAMSSLILAQVAVDPSSPSAAGARALLKALLPHLADQGGVPAPTSPRPSGAARRARTSARTSWPSSTKPRT